MADPVRGLSLASHYHPLSPHRPPPSSLDKHDKSGVYLLKKTWRESGRGGADKKQCKINTELVVPALLLLFPVCAAEET